MVKTVECLLGRLDPACQALIAIADAAIMVMKKRIAPFALLPAVEASISAHCCALMTRQVKVKSCKLTATAWECSVIAPSKIQLTSFY